MRLLFTVAAVTGLVFAACADAPERTIGPGPEKTLNARSGPPVAPGSIVAGSIAFISGRTGRSEMFVMNPGGSRIQQLTDSDRDEVLDNLRIEWIQNRPAWSPDGRKLLVTRRAWDLSVTPNALIHDVHILDLDDPEPRLRRLMENPQPSGGAAWSPDGGKVAYCSFNPEPTGLPEIYIVDIPTQTMKRTGSGKGCWPHWSPDGSKIAFHTVPSPGSRIAVLDVATDEVTYITTHAPDNVANDFVPRWSADGERLVFASNRDRDETGARYPSVFVVRSDGGGEPRNVTPIPSGITVPQGWVSDLPTWGNNGNHIYFHGLRPGNGGFGQIYRTDRWGGETVQLTAPPRGSVQPDVRPVVRP